MIRKAKTLKSLDKLNLSTSTKTYLNNHFDSIEEVIREGRIDAFEQDFAPPRNKPPRWKSELISALTDAGFIRPMTDFLMTHHEITNRCGVYKEWRYYFAIRVEQLSNKQYEEFESLSCKTIEEVEASSQSRLAKREYEVLCLLFGLDHTGTFSILEHWEYIYLFLGS